MGEIPVVLRVASAASDRSYELAGVTYDSAVPGGFGQATFSIPRLVSDPPEDLALFSRVVLYDRRTGDVAWAGELKDPGRSVSEDGHSWTLSAVGGGSHADDVFEPRAYIMSGPDGWEQTAASSPQMTAGPGLPPDKDAPADAEDVDALLFTVPEGTIAGTGDRVASTYMPSLDAHKAVGAINFRHLEGVTGGGWTIEALTVNSDGENAESIRSSTFDTNIGVSGAPKYVGVDWTNRREAFRIRVRRNGASTMVGGDQIWASVQDLRITMRLKDKLGADISADPVYVDEFLHSHHVVRDLLGRALPMFAAIELDIFDGTHEIDQMAYWDGCRPSDVLNDLMTLEDAYWAAWEPDSATGLYRFVWVEWPTEPRYVATTDDGFDSPGSSTEVYNLISVRYREGGRTRTWTQSQTVEGLTYDRAPDDVDLADELGSLKNAQRYATRFLARHARPTNSGTVTVDRPIYDRLDGRWIDPHMLRPGCLVSVLEVVPHTDSLNPDTVTGSTTYRVAEVSVSCDENGSSATLALDSPAFNEERLLARLATKRLRKR